MMTAVRGYQWSMAGESGLIVCGREYMNSLDESSFAEVKGAIESEPWLDAHYDVGEKYIRTKDRRIEYDFIGLRHNLDSVKSKARIKLLWVDEADPVSETAWAKAIPSVREDDSEIWVTWNPERKNSATHRRFRLDPPPRSKIVEMNYRDNPWFPAVLERKRQDDLDKRPDSYDHVWGGGFKKVTEGAYFAKGLAEAKRDDRIGKVAADPMLAKRAFFDIGGAGANADATAIWIVQWIDREIRVLDYVEGQGQVIGYYAQELRKRGHGDAEVYLPHDGVNANSVTGKRYEDHWREADFSVTTIPNQGKGAAMMRIEAVRRLFPRIWFNEATTEAGRDALGDYHERRDEERGIGLGPDHTWSSHAADAFGLMCIAYEEPRKMAENLVIPAFGAV